MKPAIFISLGILAYAIFIVWHGFRSFKSTSESSESFQQKKFPSDGMGNAALSAANQKR